MSRNSSAFWRSSRRAVVAVTGFGVALSGAVVMPASAAPSTTVVINEAYGGGGNSGAPFTNDFVELRNNSTSAINLTGYKVMYYSASGNLGNTCTLSGSIQPGGYFLIQQAAGATPSAALPTPDQTCTAAMSGSAGSVVLADASGTVIDTVGYGATATKNETAPAGGTTNAQSVSRTNGVDTDDNSKDFTVGTPTPQNSAGGGTTNPPVDPNPTAIPIAEIQGTGATTPKANTTVATKGVVTASYPTGGFNGFYIQTPGTGGVKKSAGQASDGIFVYTGSAPTAKVGECYTVTGTATEYNGLTQISSPTLKAESNCAPVVPTDLVTLPSTDAEKEAYEGMLVLPKEQYTITNNYALNTFGQLGLSEGDQPLWQATDRVDPAEAPAFEADQLTRLITLDDGSSWNYMNNTTAQKSPLPYLSQETPVRTASHVTFNKPVILDYRFQWNFQPTTQVIGTTNTDFITTENDRPKAAPQVGGDLKLAGMNVLNYFTDLGQDETGCKAYTDMYGTPVASNNCTVRGAYTPAAFKDQQDKIVAALAAMDADVVGLMEIENTARFGKNRDAAVKALVDALNAKLGSEVYAFAPSPATVPATEDVIRMAFIYKKATVKPVGEAQILDTPAFSNARQPFAQKFEGIESGKQFVAVANHFKSKGSGVDDGTGQGLSNPSREAQARDLTAWTNTTFKDDAVFLIGDFNAYTRETPMQIMEQAGYTELVRKFNPESASYQFSGRLGSLDHALANDKALAMVTGADDFSINGDESVAMQYSRRKYNIVDFFEPTMYASSDHDPVMVGIAAPAKTAQDQTITFNAPATATYGDTVTLDATASSGLPVTYTTSTPNVCTVEGNKVTILTSGDCTIEASQAGNTAYNPAAPVSRTIAVNKAVLTGTVADQTVYAGTPVPEKSVTWTGFKNGETFETSGITGAPTCTSEGDTATAAGQYPITCIAGTLASDKYSFEFKPGNVTVKTGLYPVTPSRLVDTRLGTGAQRQRLAPGQTITVKVAGKGGVPVGATGAYLNVTAINPTDEGWLIVAPTGSNPSTSNINYDGATVAGGVLTRLGADGSVTIRNSGMATVDVAVDAYGFVVGGANNQPGDVAMQSPQRLVDTRLGLGVPTRIPAYGSATFKVAGTAGMPANTGAGMLNLVAVDPKATGYLTAYPAGAARPTVSNLNFAQGISRANLSVVPVGANGSVTVYNSSPQPVDLIVDSFGYTIAGTPTLPGHIGTVAPQRILDTRSGLGGQAGPLTARQTLEFPTAIVKGMPSADKTSAVLGNVTAVAPTNEGWMALFPAGLKLPTVSTLNFAKGQTADNAAMGVLGARGDLALHNGSLGTTHGLTDVTAYVLK